MWNEVAGVAICGKNGYAYSYRTIINPTTMEKTRQKLTLFLNLVAQAEKQDLLKPGVMVQLQGRLVGDPKYGSAPVKEIPQTDPKAEPKFYSYWPVDVFNLDILGTVANKEAAPDTTINFYAIGNAGRDTELRYLPSGDGVANGTIATNRVYTDPQTNAEVKQTTWIKAAFWGKLAEVASQYIGKGKQVFIRGHLHADPDTGAPRLWDAKDGSKGASFEVSVSEMKLLGSRGTNGAAAGTGAEATEAPEEEIPF